MRNFTFMRHTFLVVTVKWLKSVYIYGSYRKTKTGVPLFWNSLYILLSEFSHRQRTYGDDWRYLTCFYLVY